MRSFLTPSYSLSIERVNSIYFGFSEQLDLSVSLEESISLINSEQMMAISRPLRSVHPEVNLAI